jgi:hypothetical protein
MNGLEKYDTDLAVEVGKIAKRLTELEERVNKLSKDGSQVDLLSDEIENISERIDELEGLNLSNRVTDIENIVYKLRDALEVR